MNNIVYGKYTVIVDSWVFDLIQTEQARIWIQPKDTLRGRKIPIYAHIILRLNNKDLRMKLHHFVIGQPINKLVVDHINRNKMDNRKENLRIVTVSENNKNRVMPRLGERRRIECFFR